MLGDAGIDKILKCFFAETISAYFYIIYKTYNLQMQKQVSSYINLKAIFEQKCEIREYPAKEK